jgi:hypothetical protein
MAENEGFDLTDPEEKSSFPWALVIGVGVVLLAIAIWMLSSRGQRTADGKTVDMLTQELIADKANLDTEKDKVFDLTNELDARKAAINSLQAEDRQKAVADYNQLAKQQVAQREKVKSLAEQYNQKINRLNELKGE